MFDIHLILKTTLYAKKPTKNDSPTIIKQENNVRVPVKNVPLSAADDQIIRALETSDSKCDIVTCFRERLRIDFQLTNCKTGDRILICKPFQPPLPKSMKIGKYWASIFHFGQATLLHLQMQQVSGGGSHG